MAMNMDALLRIKADVQGENNIRRLGNSLQGLEGQVKNAALSFNSLKSTIGGFAAAIAGSAIIGGLSAVVKRSIDVGDELFNMQQKTGIAATALIGIGNAAKLADVDMGQMVKGLTKLNVNMVKAAEGNEDLARKFKALGVDVKDANGKVMPTDKVLKQIADRFADMPDGAQKAAAAVALFGKAGTDLIPLLNDGAAAMEKFTYKVSEDFAARSDQFNDTITEFGFKTKGFGLELTDALLPALQSILEVFGELFDTKQDWTALFETIKFGIRAIATVIYATIKLVDQLIKAVVYSFDAIGKALQGDFEAAGRALSKGFGAGLEQAKRDFEQIGKLWTDSAAPTGRIRSRGMELDTTAADERAATAARRAATEQQRLAERRENTWKKVLDLQEKLRRSVQDLNNEYQGIGASPVDKALQERNAALEDNKRIVKDLTQSVMELWRDIKKEGGDLDLTPFKELIEQIGDAGERNAQKQYADDLKKIYADLGDEAYNAALAQVGLSDSFSKTSTTMAGLRDGVAQYMESLGSLQANIAGVTVNALRGLEDAIVRLTTTGKFSFKDFALSIIEDLSRMVTRMLILAPIMQTIQSLLPGGGFLSGKNALKTPIPGWNLSANGNIFAQNGIVPFAMGGVVDRPTIFPFAKGVGLMGEAGPEAIIPLKRGADGKLGVAGGGGTSVVVNVDASGTSVQGDTGNGAALGRAVSQAVQAELIKQRRPGGLLAA